MYYYTNVLRQMSFICIAGSRWAPRVDRVDRAGVRVSIR